MNDKKAAKRYTYIRTGGEYEFIGMALGAGTLRGLMVSVYANAETGQLFVRTVPDFEARMRLIP